MLKEYSINIGTVTHRGAPPSKRRAESISLGSRSLNIIMSTSSPPLPAAAAAAAGDVATWKCRNCLTAGLGADAMRCRACGVLDEALGDKEKEEEKVKTAGAAAAGTRTACLDAAQELTRSIICCVFVLA
jgi:rubredoxin